MKIVSFPKGSNFSTAEIEHQILANKKRIVASRGYKLRSREKKYDGEQKS